jgi:hypothetical protein
VTRGALEASAWFVRGHQQIRGAKVFRIPLDDYVIVNEPGKYRLTVELRLKLRWSTRQGWEVTTVPAAPIVLEFE